MHKFYIGILVSLLITTGLPAQEGQDYFARVEKLWSAHSKRVELDRGYHAEGEGNQY